MRLPACAVIMVCDETCGWQGVGRWGVGLGDVLLAGNCLNYVKGKLKSYMQCCAT